MVDVVNLVDNGLKLLLGGARLAEDSDRAQSRRLDNVHVLLDELVRYFEHGTELLVLGLDDGNVCATEGEGNPTPSLDWNPDILALHLVDSLSRISWQSFVTARPYFQVARFAATRVLLIKASHTNAKLRAVKVRILK